MQRVTTSTAVAVLPADPAGGTPGYFANPNPGGGVPATIPNYEWYNNVQEEICALPTAAGIALDGTARNQMLLALRAAGVFTTAAQFDATTKAATTAFVKSAGLQAAGNIGYSTTQTIPASAVGSYIQANGAGSITLTLPLAAGVPAGSMLLLESVATAAVTFSRQGAESIVMNGSTSVNSINLSQGDTLWLESSTGGTWTAVGGSAQLGYSAAFGSTIATPGYQKLPSGLIIQWGTSTASAAGSAVTFPLTFPNSIFQITTGQGGAAGSPVYTGSLTTSGFNFFAATTASHFWLALGK